MKFLSRLSDLWLDFFFPKTPLTIRLESLSPEHMLNILPQTSIIDDGNVVSVFDYRNPVVREVIWELKYGGNRTVAEKLGEILYDVISAELEDRALFQKFQSPLLVPIPISDKRHFERGWNQSELLCRSIKKCDTANTFAYLPGQLIRHKHTQSQTHTTSKKERLRNIINSMRVRNPASVRGRCVVLIDDVFTTGSTFAEARRALKEAGARRILCVSVAH